MAPIRRSSHQNDLKDTEWKEGVGLLRNDGDFSCDLCAAHLSKRLLPVKDLTLLGGKKAVKDLQERGLS
jgi:hypothetical protein